MPVKRNSALSRSELTPIFLMMLVGNNWSGLLARVTVSLPLNVSFKVVKMQLQLHEHAKLSRILEA